MTERSDAPKVPPIMFGEPIPEGRKAGDCDYCGGEESSCDCALEWVDDARGVHS